MTVVSTGSKSFNVVKSADFLYIELVYDKALTDTPMGDEWRMSSVLDLVYMDEVEEKNKWCLVHYIEGKREHLPNLNLLSEEELFQLETVTDFCGIDIELIKELQEASIQYYINKSKAKTISI